MQILWIAFEILLFIQMISSWGLGMTILVYLLPTVVGFYFLFFKLQKQLMEVQSKMNSQLEPPREVLVMAMGLLSAVFMILPSLILKIIGVLIFPKLIRRALALVLGRLFIKNVFTKYGNSFRFSIRKNGFNENGTHDNGFSENAFNSEDVYEAKYRVIKDIKQLSDGDRTDGDRTYQRDD